MSAEGKFLTPQEVSDKHNIPVNTLANLRWRRVGPRYYRRGGRIFYDPQDIEEYIQLQPVSTLDQF